MSNINKNNVVGALIFFAYIIAALVLTAIISYDLYQKHRSNNQVQQNAYDNQLRLYLALCVISFSTISYNMMSFLIQSYGAWNTANNLPNITPFNLQLWTWSTSSELFLEFADVIIGERHNFWWAQLALLYGFAWNMYMAVRGSQKRIPHLWAYFLLDQILPASFSQNLFLTAELLHGSNPTSKVHKQQSSSIFQIVHILAYVATLLVAPLFIRTEFFIPVYGIGRFLLFATLFTFGAKSNLRVPYMVFAMASIAAQLFQTLQVDSFSRITRAINVNPAVSTVGYDVIIGISSLVLVLLSKDRT